MSQLGGINEAVLRQFAPRPGQRPLLPELSPQAQVALMCRMLFREGWNDHIAGHITCRQADGTILTNPWELAWDELTASDILTLDEDGNIIRGEWNTTPALALHLQLHQLRPDIGVVIHNHPHWSGLWANLGRVPAVYDQSSAHVGGELILYDEFAGTFGDEDRSLVAAKALGDAGWALLANHGALVVGRDLRQAHLRVVTLEWRCKRAWEVELAGGATPLSEDVIAGVSITDDNGFPFLWEAMARREIRHDPSVLD